MVQQRVDQVCSSWPAAGCTTTAGPFVQQSNEGSSTNIKWNVFRSRSRSAGLFGKNALPPPLLRAACGSA